MSVDRMWRIIGSMPNFTVHGKTMISAVMVPAAGSCEVRYQVGIGTDDQYFWVVGGRGDPDARCAASVLATLLLSGRDGRRARLVFAGCSARRGRALRRGLPCWAARRRRASRRASRRVPFSFE